MNINYIKLASESVEKEDDSNTYNNVILANHLITESVNCSITITVGKIKAIFVLRAYLCIYDLRKSCD